MNDARTLLKSDSGLWVVSQDTYNREIESRLNFFDPIWLIADQ